MRIKYIRYIGFCALMIIMSGCMLQSDSVDVSNIQTDDYLLDQEKATISIAVTSDIHYLSSELTDGGDAYQTFIKTGDGKQMEYMDAILQAFTDTLEKEQEDVLVVSGDLTINGEQKSHEDLAHIFLEIEKRGTQVLVIPGNHDILNPHARGFEGDKQVKVDTVDPEQFENIYQPFGYEEAISRDDTSLSYLVALNRKVWILMLDTCIYENNMKQRYPEIDGQITKETLDWIKECSDEAAAVGAKVVTVTHQNLLDHSELIREGFTLVNGDAIRQVFKEQGLLLNLSGHVHIQDIATDNAKPLANYDIASGALSVYPHQYGIISIDTKTEHLSYTTKEVPVKEWANRTIQKDTNLLHFDRYKEAYFGQFAYDMAIKAYGDAETLTKKEVRIVAQTMKRLNLRYFAGREDENATDPIIQEGMLYLEKFPKNFLKSYAKSILTDPDIEDHSLELDEEKW